MRILKFKNSIGWLFIIIIVTIMPVSGNSRIVLFSGHFDKLVHFALFMIFSLLLLFDILRVKNEFFPGYTLYITVFLLGTLIGLVTELVQHFFIPGRSGSIFDFFSDITGIIFGIAGFRLLKLK